MLTEICAEIKNYFIDPATDIHAGDFVIEDGGIELPFLIEGQFFRVVGSALNDGVWQYPATQMWDERFVGAVWAMRVPPALIALAAEIEDWQETNAATLAKPYQSESFGGYTYSLKSGRVEGTGWTWRDQFSARLNPYRRLFAL